MAVHYGRSFHGDLLEKTCPCGKAPCGLVDERKVDPECEEHPLVRSKTIRQMHDEWNCPALAGLKASPATFPGSVRGD